MLKTSQVNALNDFHMGLKICHEDLLAYVACGEVYRFFFQIVFLSIRFAKNCWICFGRYIGERKCIF